MVARRRCRRGLAPIVAMSCWFLMSSLPGSAEDVNSEAAQHFAAAQQAQNAGLLDNAAQEYQKVIQLLPDAAEAYASLGLVYNAQSKYAQSVLALSKAENLKPGLPGVSLYLGIDYLKQHEPTHAIPHLQRSLRVEPKNEQVYTWLSQAYSDENQLNLALEYLRKASGLFPSDPILLLDLGQLYRRAADEQIERVLTGAAATPLRHIVFGDIYRDEQLWQNARAHYFRALEQDPHWHGAHFGLGEIAFQNQEFDLASEEYQKELQVDPKSAAAMAKLAEIALLNGKPGDSLALLKSALAVSAEETAHALEMPQPSLTEAFKVSKEEEQQLRAGLPFLAGAPSGAAQALAVALVQHLLGQDDLSLEAWKQFVESAPRVTPASPYRRAVLDFDAGRMEAAEGTLDSWLGAHSLDYQARYLLAQTYHFLSRETLEKLLATAPDSYPAHQALAEIYQQTQKNDQALAEYGIVERMAPNLQGIHLAMGGILLKMHRPDQALPALEDELRLNPDSAEANADLGEIYLERTESAKAIPYLERAVKEDPKLQSAHQELGRAYYAQKQYTKAIAQLQDVAQYDLDGSVHFQLGLIYRATGQSAKAGEQFEISRKLKLDSLSHSESEMATFQKLSQ